MSTNKYILSKHKNSKNYAKIILFSIFKKKKEQIMVDIAMSQFLVSFSYYSCFEMSN